MAVETEILICADDHTHPLLWSRAARRMPGCLRGDGRIEENPQAVYVALVERGF